MPRSGVAVMKSILDLKLRNLGDRLTIYDRHE